MKKSYNSPEIANIAFKAEDIITSSVQLMMGTHSAGSASSANMESQWNDELNT